MNLKTTLILLVLLVLLAGGYYGMLAGNIKIDQNQLEAKKLLFESDKYQAVPNKYKILAGIAAAAVLGSELCTEMWTKMGLSQGVTIKEISEIIQVARYMKMATVNDTVKTTYRMLAEAK